MAEPSTPVSPFNPPITQVPRGGPGCGKPLLVGCGIVLFLVAAGLITMAVEWRAVLRGYLSVLEATLAPRLPADLSVAERDRLHHAFAAAATVDSSDPGKMLAVQRLQRKVLALSGSQAMLSHQDVREMAEDLEALQSTAPGVPPPGIAAPPPGAAAPPGTASPGSPPAAAPPLGTGSPSSPVA